MIFLRRKYKERPKQFGPFSAVQSALFHNLSSVYKVDPKSCLHAFFCWSPGDQRDYAKDLIGTDVTGVNYVENALELTSSDYIEFPNQKDLSSAMTVIANVRADTFPAAAAIVGEQNIIAANSGWLLYGVGSKAKLYITKYNTYFGWSPTLTVNTDYSLIGSWDKAVDSGKPKLWANGVAGVQSASGLTTDITYDASTTKFRIGWGTPYSWDGLIRSSLIFDTYLSEESRELFTANPYGWMQPVPQKTIFLPLGGDTNLPNSLNQSQALDAVTLTQKHTLSTASLAQAMSLDSSTLSVAVSLIVQAMNQAQALDDFGLTQKHNLLVDSLNQAQTAENIILTLAEILEVANLLQSQGLSGVELLQKNILSITELNQSQSVAALDLIQKHNLIIAGVTQGQDINAVDIIQAHNLTVNDIFQAQALGGITFELAELLVVADLLQSQSIDTIDLTQAHALAVESLTQAQDIGSVELSIALLLEVAGLSQAQTLDAFDITQVNVLAVDNLGQSHDLGSMSLTQAHELLINDLAQSQNISAVTFVTTKGKVTVTMSMKVPGMDLEIKTPNINFEME